MAEPKAWTVVKLEGDNKNPEWVSCLLKYGDETIACLRDETLAYGLATFLNCVSMATEPNINKE